MSPNPSNPPHPIVDAASKNIHADLLEVGETLIAVVRRHPIGLIFLYLEVLVGVIAIIALFAFVVPETLANLSPTSKSLVTAAIIFGLAILVLFLFAATYVYRQNRILITDRGLVQIKQISLFIRKVTRLSYSNVEEVSAEQRGILSTIFNYGFLLVQTAGPHENFEFKYCPDPNRYADMIIEARQAYADSLKEE